MKNRTFNLLKKFSGISLGLVFLSGTIAFAQTIRVFDAEGHPVKCSISIKGNNSVPAIVLTNGEAILKPGQIEDYSGYKLEISFPYTSSIEPVLYLTKLKTDTGLLSGEFFIEDILPEGRQEVTLYVKLKGKGWDTHTGVVSDSLPPYDQQDY